MRVGAPVRVFAVAALLALSPRATYAETGPGRSLTLTDAIAFALEKNEGIVVERESLVSAREAATGARGAYDPVLELDLGFRRATEPVNSAFSGAPQGEAAPTSEAVGTGSSLRQLLPTGGAVSVRAAASRETTDGGFALLSPAYGTEVGLELRQPLLRDRAIDAARFGLRVAASDRERAEASLRREVTETVAAVERAYWTLAALRREVLVREEAVRLAEEQLSETGIRIEKGSSPRPRSRSRARSWSAGGASFSPRTSPWLAGRTPSSFWSSAMPTPPSGPSVSFRRTIPRWRSSRRTSWPRWSARCPPGPSSMPPAPS